MPGSGPQKYPGASTAYFYQSQYGGDLMEVNVVVLHTTEGRTLPGYSGGGSAPNLTAVPDFAARKLRWYQHFDIDRSSRALRNLAGGVETNTNNVVQVELVGTCDPTTHKKWGTAEHIYWPEAPEWALQELAVFLRWLNREHGVPLVGPGKWPAYPTSYSNGGGQRMTGSAWNAFRGVCGHMHVPENDHGDPGAIDFPRLIALAKGTTPEEDDMALTDAEIEKIATATATRTLTIDGVIDNPNPVTAPTNSHISLETSVRNLEILARRTEKAVAALPAVELTDAQIATLASAVAADPALAEQIAEKVAVKLATRLAS